MSELDAALDRLHRHDGVDALILLGGDGLVVKRFGADTDDEPIAARVPGITAACDALGSAANRGRFRTAVLEFDEGVVIIAALSGDLLLAALVRPGVGFAGLLRELRNEQAHLIELI